MSTVRGEAGTGSRGLAPALRRMFASQSQVRGEHYLAAVDGTIDAMGGVVGRVQGTRREPYAVRLMPALDDPESLLAACSCPVGEGACKHLWAVLRVIDERSAWPARLGVPTKLEITGFDDPDLELIAEDDAEPLLAVRGRASESATLREIVRGHRLTAPAAPTWRERLGAWPLAVPPPVGSLARLEYIIEAQPLPVVAPGQLPPPFPDERACTILVATSTVGKGGAVRRKLGRVEIARLGPADAEIRGLLFGVEGLVESRYGDSARYFNASASTGAAARVATARVPDVVPRIAATGRLGWVPVRATSRFVPLHFDPGPPWALEVRFAPTPAGAVAVSGDLVRDDERLALDALTAIPGGGLAIVGERLLRVEGDGLARWWRLLAGGLDLPTAEVPALLEATCRHATAPRLRLDELGWEVVDVPLARRIVIEQEGRAGGRFEAHAELSYAGQLVGGGGGALVEPHARRVVRRRLEDERAAALELRELGGYVERPWAVPGPRLRELIERGAAAGWEVWYGKSALRGTAVVSADVTSGIDWFDVQLTLADDGATATFPELLASLRSGRPVVRLSDGTSAMIPSWLEARAAAFGSAPQVDGAVRFRPAEVLMVAALLDRVPDARVDAGFARLRDRLESFAGLAPRAAPRGFKAKLRDYQREGLGWLHFLRELGLGGCLADDMGLGKTVQVLALLAGVRTKAAARKPSIVVAPRSLVFHWIDEARRFAPTLRTLEWHGAARATRAKELATADLIVTTYATLRQDLEQFSKLAFDVVVLDEAHAIKTASTQAASAVRALQADHRLALTGTPVENRLEDLASIFDFLNPGLLGRPAALRAIAAADGGDPRATELGQARVLGKVLRPFLLRRTKQEVLTELPAKTEELVSCRLEGVERKRYDELRLHYRRALLPAVDRDGIGKSSIIVLEALLRLRQAALHPGLLDPRRADDGSAKLDALVEHLHDAIASGHRALVFSQFTTLLGIVRARLDREQIAHEYLDGQTVDRRGRVAAFQSGTASVFLLSLKAGGTGLNLTAADHVFLLDPWWNPAVEAQAIDRVHRIGQARPVTAYRLVAEDTVEQKILALQAHKRAVFDGVFEDKGVVARLTASDLRALLD